jgi:hypothetical protein
MSRQLISRSSDLKKLRDEGYDVEIRSGFLLVKDVPYVNAKKEVKLGILVSELTLAGDVTATPSTHVAMFAGEYPCDKDGSPLEKIRHGGGQQLADNLTVQYSFSSKPAGGRSYKDYYEKMTAYVAIFLSHAHAIDPNVMAQTFPVIPTEEDESVFKYIDTASSRAGINMANKKLGLAKVAIVGLGGTGSYVLDLVAKTPVKEVHLFDGDVLLSHNAFRSPSAASVEELRSKPKKVAYLKDMYSKMRRGIVNHGYYIDASNVDELQGMDFVFLCIDAGDAKKLIVENLDKFGIPFIDVGMGVELVEDSLRGILRVTTSTAERRHHLRQRVSLASAGDNADYDRNIQIADLNALNAALAVVKWKKLYGFYLDFEKEHNSTYTIDGNMLLSEDQ